ncbi:hypothetical protein C8Q80DRAFT_884452 [Daedaleopsis nitida]|nr:hypothetical protein C8Q80DRAFT_884452 [Daedaleopsis nitida]
MSLSSMPTCLASSSGLLRSSAQHHSSHACRLSLPPRTRFQRAARHASSAPANGSQGKHDEQRAHVLTVLHKTTALLPRILPNSRPGRNGISLRESLVFWDDVLGKVYEDLTLSPEKREKDRVRVVVYGVDGASGANELVTALLEDPFASDEQKQFLRSRWTTRPEGSRTVKLQYGTTASPDGDIVFVQSSWLQSFGMPIEITEFQPSSPILSPDAETAKTLFAADVPIILCDPISTPVTSILPVPTDPALPISRENTVFALHSPSPIELAAVHGSSLATQDALHVVFVDPTRALHGLDMLNNGAASPMSVQRYQDDVSGSNISSVTRAVKEILASSATASNVTPAARVVAAHARTGRALIKDALATCRAVLRKAELEGDAVLTGTSTLREQMEEVKAKVYLEVFGVESKDGDEIAKAVAQAKKRVQPTMDALQWYKLFWRVDDVREVVTGAVDRAWCRDLERKLVFHAGRLASLQSTLADSANALSRSFPPASAYHSPVLHNTLARLAAAPAYPLSATALTAPLRARQGQLEFPTERLHASAQRAVVGMSGSVLGGAGIAWAGWATELQLLGGMVDVGMSTETAVGAGMLCAAVGVRWAVGRWERAKRRWWKDWDRIGEGLDRDLKATLAQTMEDHVTVVPEIACSSLEGLVSKRKAETEELREEVQRLEADMGLRHGTETSN